MQKTLIAPPADPPVRQRPPAPARRGLALFLVSAVVLASLFIALFQWNWLRGPLAAAISTQIHRPVRIAGDLTVAPWSLTPSASVEGLLIGEPAGAGRAPMARFERVTVVARLGSLLFGPLRLPLVEADRPAVTLLAAAAGRRNWRFAAAPAGASFHYPRIDHLVIRGGRLSYADLKRRIRFTGTIVADERAGAGAADAAQIAGALSVAGAPWSGGAPVIDAPRFLLRVKLLDALAGRASINLAQADGPRIRLLRDAAGRENWSTGPNGKPLHLPPIGRLVVTDGALAYDDLGRGLRFAGDLTASQSVGASGRGAFRLAGTGVIGGEPFTARIGGGPLANVDRTRPYAFSADISSRTSHIALTAAIAHPFDFGQIAGALRVRGPDLSQLNRLTGLVLPASPPYDLAAGFARRGKVSALSRIAGRVGDSDLAGELRIDHTAQRPVLAADLRSRRLMLADLYAVIGGAPRRTAGHTLSPAEQATAARLKAEHRLLPDTPLGLDRLRDMDATVSYSADAVDAGKTRLHALAIRLALQGGVLSVDPLRIDLPQGRVDGMVRIDARGPSPTTTIDVSLVNAGLETIVGRGKASSPPLAGALYARTRIAGTGRSVAQVAATANGGISVVVANGEIRQSLAELLGIDATKSLFLLIAKSGAQTPIRCAVADFSARNGVLDVRQGVIDTGVVLAKVNGTMDLRNETIDLVVAGKPKKFRLVRIAAPITIKGRFEDPDFGVQAGKAIPQAAASIALGVLVAPLAVAMPFVAPGLAHDADCPALIAAAQLRSPPIRTHFNRRRPPG